MLTITLKILALGLTSTDSCAKSRFNIGPTIRHSEQCCTRENYFT